MQDWAASTPSAIKVDLVQEPVAPVLFYGLNNAELIGACTLKLER